MTTKLELVSDRSDRTCEEPQFVAHPARRRRFGLWRRLRADERGAVTAEYAIVILAGVAFAGLLVAIMRSDQIREMLVQLVQNALGSAG